MADDLKDKKEEEAFQALDAAKIKEEIIPDIEKLAQEKAEAIAEEKVAKKMQELGNRISGKEEKKYSWEQRGQRTPKDWHEAMAESERLAEEKAEEKLKEWTEKQKKEREEKERMTQAQMFLKRQQWEQDIKELQDDGLIPKYSEEVQKKIDARVRLSEADFNKDKGLQAWRKLIELSQENNTTPYKAFHRYYKKQPAGAKAPVLGGTAATSTEPERKYEDIAKMRKQIFGS